MAAVLMTAMPMMVVGRSLACAGGRARPRPGAARPGEPAGRGPPAAWTS